MTKAKLLVLSVDHRGKTFELTADKYTCGRSSDCDICIPDSTMSSHHCDFIRSGNSYILKDNHSTNGTKVNGNPVEEQPLSHTDMLTLGTVDVLFDAADGGMLYPKTETNIDLRADDMTKTVVCIQSPYTTQKVPAYNAGGTKNKGFLILVVILTAVIAVLVFMLVSYFLSSPNAESSASGAAVVSAE